ncbi:MAG TPA: serine/threonine-protein kinase, partial [Blastocatellia bacterium]|nr:serine/threonine-protein kinase [Blastocatellia bacterium]
MTEGPDNSDHQPYHDREQLIADAVAAYHDLLLQGETIDPDAYCRDYPELDPELRAQLLAFDEIDAVLMPNEKPSDARSLELPARLSGYKILGEIGSGGMGRVLLALDERLGRKVAVKTLSPRYAGNSKLRERFMREARALARLDHPNIVRIYNLGDADEEPHFVMERIEGASLTEAARRLALTQKIDLMLKVALTVDFLHRRRMIHRDLKPGNILVGPDLEPKVLDFGLATQFDDLGERLTQVGEIMGTP